MTELTKVFTPPRANLAQIHGRLSLLRILKFFLLASLINLLCLLPQALAAPQCQKIFSAQFNQAEIARKFLLDSKKLNAVGFEIDSTGILMDIKTARLIGQIDLVDVPNLYEWAPLDYQEAWIWNGGLSTKDVNEQIAAPGQAGGKGYYISTDPVDSEGFGDGLTPFQTKGPMVILDDRTGRYVDAQTDFVMRLQKAGIDGARANGTWYSIISAKHLKVPADGSIRDPFWSDLKNLGKIYDIQNKLSLSKFWRFLPANNILRSLKDQTLTPSQKNQVVAQISTTERLPYDREKTIGKEIASVLFENRFGNLEAFNRLLSSGKEEDLKTLLLSPEAREFGRYAQGSSSKTENLYSSILNYFDVKTLALMASGEKLSEVNSFQTVKVRSVEMEKRFQSLEFPNWLDFRSFLSLAENFLGQKLKFRGWDVIMTSEVKKKNNPILRVGNQVVETLKKNRFLTVSIVKSYKDSSDITVDYLTIEKLNNLLKLSKTDPNTNLILPDSLVKEVSDFEKITAPGKMNERSKFLYQKILQEMTALVFPLPSTGTGIFHMVDAPGDRVNAAWSAYKAFMSIHPLEDKNGRVGRLLYDYINNMKRAGPERGGLPIFDLDLFSTTEQVEHYSDQSNILKLWLSQAKTDQEFLQMCQRALNVWVQVNPELKSTFPELSGWDTPQ